MTCSSVDHVAITVDAWAQLFLRYLLEQLWFC